LVLVGCSRSTTNHRPFGNVKSVQERASQEKQCALSSAPFYEDDSCTIYHCDIRECPELPDVACLVTSPPYNVGIDYGQDVDDVLPWDLSTET
jgi:hypothetical protein